MTVDVRLVLLAIPAVILLSGVLVVVWSLSISLGRRRARHGWTAATATVTGVLHGPDGVAGGRHRFAPAYEFDDATGTRRPGRGDVFGPEQHLVGAQIGVVYNPENPAESALRSSPAARGRLSAGLILVAFGVAGLAMFGPLLP